MATNGALRFEAPIDAFIKQIAGNGAVQANQQLVLLESPMLDKMLARLANMQSQLAIAARPLNDGRLDQAIQTMTNKQGFLQQAVTSNQQIVNDVQQQVTVGKLTSYDLQQAMIVLYSAQSSYADAALAVSQAVLNKQDALDKIAIAQSSFTSQQTYLNALQAALTINAPVAGLFTAHVVLGSFVKAGHTLGTVQV